MADSTTPTYSLIQPEIDGADGTWGVSTNSNWLSVDNLLSGTSPLTALNVTGAINAGSLNVQSSTGPARLKVEGTYAGGTEWANVGVIEIGGQDQAWLDLKAPNSDDYDVRLRHNRLSNTSQLAVNNGSLDIVTAQDSPVILSHQSSAKLQTTSTGIDVTGTIIADGLTLGAGQIATFNSGAGGDLQISGDATGSFSLIKQTGGGDLIIQGQNGSLRNDANDAVIAWFPDYAALAWRGASGSGTKLATTATGIDVTGTVDLDNLTISSAQGTAGQVLKSTGSGIEWGSGGAGGEETLAQTLAFGNSTGGSNVIVSAGDDLLLSDSSKIKLQSDGSDYLQIYKNGAGDSYIEEVGGDNLVIKGQNGSLQNDAGDALVAWDNARAELYWRGATGAGAKLATTETGVDVTGTVFADAIKFTTDATDDAKIFTEVDGFQTDLVIQSKDDPNDKIVLRNHIAGVGSVDVLVATSAGVQSSPTMALRSTSIANQDLINYFGMRLLNNATAVTTYAIPQVSITRVGKTVVICNPTNKTITLDADGGTDTVAQYVWILDGVTLMARNGDWQIKAGGVIELVQVGSDIAGGSETAPNYVIFGAGILAV